MDVDNKNATERETPGNDSKRGWRKWLNNPECFLYISYFLSSWGDGMWQFACSLYLVVMNDEKLQLAATFGFIASGSILLFGSALGDWVDRNKRLKVVGICLFVTNGSIIVCSAIICIHLSVPMTNSEATFSSTIIVALALTAYVATITYKIAIERDWIVVIADGDQIKLTNLNAITRTIDLSCTVATPLVIGQIMTFGSHVIAGVFIIGWNICSVILQYGLLMKIYHLVPQLATKIRKQSASMTKNQQAELERLKLPTNDNDVHLKQKEIEVYSNGNKATPTPINTKTSRKRSVLKRVRGIIWLFVKGWRIYSRQKVVFAGVALAFLYMTVLGFDSTTLGYIYANQVSEAMVGVWMSAASATGVLGICCFAFLRRKYGLHITGLVSFNAQLLCLVLCVASIWTAGSPFGKTPPLISTNETSNDAMTAHNATSYYETNNTAIFFLCNETTNENICVHQKHDEVNQTLVNAETENEPNLSITLFLIGIIMSRVGLWMSDLVVTQLLQENVQEKQRGIVNGVQNSLNMLMELVKFGMVILLPSIYTYGYLILLSFAFIAMASGLFELHVLRSRRRRKRQGDTTEQTFESYPSTRLQHGLETTEL